MNKKFLARPALAIAIVATLLAACGDSNEREAKYLKRGEALFESGEYEKARLEFKNAAQIKPTSPEVRYRLGLVDEAEGDLRNAWRSRTTMNTGIVRPVIQCRPTRPQIC